MMNEQSFEQTPSSAIDGIVKRLKQPKIVFLHLLFRTLAIVAYVLCNFFSNSFVLNFIVVVLLLSFDFWVVKNVSGRLLVGLRWWNYVKSDGSSKWIYECKQDMSGINSLESTIFWTSLYVCPAIWGLFFISALLYFRVAWLMIVLIALMLNIANIIGYNNCKQDAKSRLSSLVPSFVTDSIWAKASSTFEGFTNQQPATGESQV